jgi:chromosome partitioning protein
MNDSAYYGLSEAELRELGQRFRAGLGIIAVASGAKGSGKSTLAANIAIQAPRAGLGPMVLMDAARRGGLTQWWDKRRGQKPQLSSLGGASRLGDTVERLHGMGAKLIIIDTGPDMDEMVEQVLAMASLVVIPCRPERNDVFAADMTSEVAQMLGTKTVFVVSSAIRGARMSDQIAVELAKHGTVAPATLFRRPEVAEAIAKGQTVMETDPEGEAAKEFERLWEYLHERLGKIVQLNFPS